MSAKSSIQVCVKVRPCEPGQTTLWQVKDNRTIQIIDSPADPCVFDYVFDQESSNQLVFDCMAKHIVEACIEGFNGTIFAYGQTSSGKTYTMMGDKENPGVMVLAAKEIFKQIARHSDRDFLLRVGFIEIYNEKIYDLLNKKNQDLKIHESNGMVHVNCEECIITCEGDLLQFLSMGNKARTVGETNMNERSSRSHAIFRIIIESRKTDRNDDDAVIQSLLNLVDLAGSERADQTGARGARLKEGGHINKSLHFLSNVIKSLAENEENKYVSFRDSKLTRILQASLGGNAFTSIICSIKPSIMEESQSTLNFAMRAKKIRLKPQMNEIVSDATMMKRLEREIKVLKDRLDEEQRRNESQIKVRLLEERIKSDTLKIISSNTIADNRNRNRRRTWCPASSNQDAVPDQDVRSESPTDLDGTHAQPKLSGLPKPSFYPMIYNKNNRQKNAPKTINIMKSLEVKEEEFKPAVDYNFGDGPEPDAKNQFWLSLTPRVNQNGEECVRDLVELAEFEKQEKIINAEWESLKKNFAAATAQIEELQAERQSLIQRNEALQADVDAVGKSKQEANEKVEQYEEELRVLKERLHRLEMENRAAVELEFQFENHKTKSKLRENELLAVLTEKNDAIDNLEKTLKELSRDVLRNSKEDHMRSICPEIESNCESICNKCAELERLLENYKKTSSNGEPDQSIACQCEQLHAEIASTRAQLESVQTAYQQMTNDVAEKSELCNRLSREVISAEEAKTALQEKFKDLELAQKQHEATQLIESMQAEYDAIKEKYQTLQQDYELLQQATAATEEQHKTLLSQNETLLLEIAELKKSFEEVQQELLEATQNGEKTFLVEQLMNENKELASKLAELNSKYNEMQQEYDDMSNQLVESMQDGDGLRKECDSLKDQLKQQQVESSSSEEKTQRIEELLTQIVKLEQAVEEKNILIDSTEATINEMREQMTNLESALLEKSFIVNKVEDYQRQIETLEKQNAEMTMVYEELQEKVKENTINESQVMSNSSRTVVIDDMDDILRSENEILTTKVFNLNVELNDLQAQAQQKDKLIEKIQSDLEVLNDRCISLEVQQVEQQAIAKQSQELLERNAAKLRDDAAHIDKLQETNAELLERSMKTQEKAELLEKQLALTTEAESSKEQYEQRINELQTALDETKALLDAREKEFKDQLDSAKLDYLQKIEFSESEYRGNLRKYNIEWEESKERYELSLDKLRTDLSAAEDRYAKLFTDKETELLCVKAEKDAEIAGVVTEKQEIESMYDESKKLVKEIQEKLNHKELIEEKRREGQQEHADYESQIKKYQQLLMDNEVNLNQLMLEKKNLQSAVDEKLLLIDQLTQDVKEQHNERQQHAAQMQQLREELEASVARGTELVDKVETLNAKIDDLTTQLAQTQCEADKLKSLLVDQESINDKLSESQILNEHLAREMKIVENKLALALGENDCQRAEIEKLRIEVENNVKLRNNACSDESKLLDKQRELEELIAEQTKQLERKCLEMQSSKNEMEFKLESLLGDKTDLEKTNHELTMKFKRMLHVEHLLQEVRVQNDMLRECNTRLQVGKGQVEEKMEKLQKDFDWIQKCKADVKSQLEQQVEQSAAALKTATAKETELCNRIADLEKDILKLNSVIKSNQDIFNSERIHLDEKLSNLMEKNHSLEEQCKAKDKLLKLESEQVAKANAENKQHLLNLQQHNEQFEKCKAELEAELKVKTSKIDDLKAALTQQKEVVNETTGKERELRCHLEKLEKEVESLKSQIKSNKESFNSERSHLDATISSLMEDKRSLEEKLCTCNDIIQKLESDIKAKANVSVESCASNTSPVARKSLDRQHNQHWKSLSTESEQRRNRRISTHDERRRHSYWNDSKSVGSMTDPVDDKCNCAVLNQKLQDCQREKYIMESKVTALSIELKNHPLKEETALLRKRLQDEHNKACDEIKRLKQKNADLVSKLNSQTASAALSVTTNQRSIPASTPQLMSTGSQTESDLEKEFKKLSDKLNDSLQLCRYRYKKIVDLEEQLKQNENTDSSNISSQTAGQINALKSHVDALKKENSYLTNKYEFAKRALKMRKDEVEELRKNAGNDSAGYSK